ncbi:MAG: hypothetical protein IPM64_08295 [Phycisphaerales bacterium]|nr:hypothetical protein [Phycisphaerales bacterium]
MVHYLQRDNAVRLLLNRLVNAGHAADAEERFHMVAADALAQERIAGEDGTGGGKAVRKLGVRCGRQLEETKLRGGGVSGEEPLNLSTAVGVAAMLVKIGRPLFGGQIGYGVEEVARCFQVVRHDSRLRQAGSFEPRR